MAVAGMVRKEKGRTLAKVVVVGGGEGEVCVGETVICYLGFGCI